MGFGFQVNSHRNSIIVCIFKTYEWYTVLTRKIHYGDWRAQIVTHTK